VAAGRSGLSGPGGRGVSVVPTSVRRRGSYDNSHPTVVVGGHQQARPPGQRSSSKHHVQCRGSPAAWRPRSAWPCGAGVGADAVGVHHHPARQRCLPPPPPLRITAPFSWPLAVAQQLHQGRLRCVQRRLARAPLRRVSRLRRASSKRGIGVGDVPRRPRAQLGHSGGSSSCLAPYEEASGWR